METGHFRSFRLIPVPMYLDSPRWAASWRQKPCIVVHTSEDLARATAARFFRITKSDSPARSPWSDPNLVSCIDAGSVEGLVGELHAGTVLDLGRGLLERPQPRRSGSRTKTQALGAVALFVVAGLWLGLGHQEGISVAELRQQARTALLATPTSEPALSPLTIFRASLAEASPAMPTGPTRGSLYVPAYSSIRATTGRAGVDLATTLSIHNTSRESVLHLHRVDYHNTQGEMLQAHLDRPVSLKPLAVVEFFVASDDMSGGSGANFIVEWASDGPITEPVVEAVMIGMSGSQSYSFVSQGRSLHPFPR